MMPTYADPFLVSRHKGPAVYIDMTEADDLVMRP